MLVVVQSLINIEPSSQVDVRALTGKFDILQKVADINMWVKCVLENSMKSILILLQTSQGLSACNLDSDLHESCEQIEKCK